jgi:heme O synthase-like polyprenyltransferase
MSLVVLAIAGGAVMIVLALQLWALAQKKAANRLVAFSISYLALLFAALFIERILGT